MKWWPDVKPLQAFTDFKFTPGVNIVWGPNGSGKSTLLTAIAHLTHSEQSGRSVVTHQSLGVVDDIYRKGLQDGMHLFCDGQGVLYYSPMSNVGLIGGMAGFDDDFISDSIESMKHKHISAGQSALAKLQQVLAHRGEEVHWKYTFREDQHPKAYEFMREQLSARCEPGPQTFLMDEPDANLDWTNKLDFWDTVKKGKEFQFIIATHSPFALRIPGANYIDLKEGYRAECGTALQRGGLWTHDWEER